jgi:acidic leucine-rich nuclear phosphoprotein 32 family protein B
MSRVYLFELLSACFAEFLYLDLLVPRDFLYFWSAACCLPVFCLEFSVFYFLPFIFYVYGEENMRLTMVPCKSLFLQDEDTEYLVQPIAQPQAMAIGNDFDAAEPDDADEDREEVDDDDEGATDQPSSSQGAKRKRDDDPSGSGDDSEDDGVEDLRPFKHH